jgi:hypothetical protein
MGVLGRFLVTVYSDGFLVHSELAGDTIEISNVGDSVVFVRDFDSASSKTVIADRNGRVATCTVALVDDQGLPLMVEQETKTGKGSSKKGSKGEEGDQADADAQAEAKAEVKMVPLWERSCSTATFGPSTPLPLVADIVFPAAGSEKLCSSIDAHNTRQPGQGQRQGRGHGASSQSTADATTAATGASVSTPLSWLWGKSQPDSPSHKEPDRAASVGTVGDMLARLQSNLQQKLVLIKSLMETAGKAKEGEKEGEKEGDAGGATGQSVDSKVVDGLLTSLAGFQRELQPLRGKAVLAQRGDCLFEDKAVIAQEAGAAAILVSNHEVGHNPYYRYDSANSYEMTSRGAELPCECNIIAPFNISFL